MSSNRKLNILLVVVYCCTFFLFAFAIFNDSSNEEVENTSLQEESTIQTDEFGIPKDQFTKSTFSVKPNETFSNILLNSGFPSGYLNEIITKTMSLIDIRKIRSGDTYHVFNCIKDSSARILVYEPNRINYLMIDVSDTISVLPLQREVTVVERSLSGVINNSLYHSLIENDADIDLAVRLSNVFAWQIDFYRIQKGDSYKVIFEEEFVGEKSVGIRKITGAVFNHNNESFYAIRFDKEKEGAFFDKEGKSLKKAFLKAPLEFSRISSRYSRNRLHPVQKVYKPHLGTDYAAPHGTPIRTVGDGVVVEASYTRGNGNYVKIKHNGTYSTQYLHMSRFAKGIRAGKRVSQGEIIGYVGSTGLATGPHLCYRFWKNGVQVDPLKEKAPPSDPVSAKNMAEFISVKNEIINKLEDTGITESIAGIPENQDRSLQ